MCGLKLNESAYWWKQQQKRHFINESFGWLKQMVPLEWKVDNITSKNFDKMNKNSNIFLEEKMIPQHPPNIDWTRDI